MTGLRRFGPLLSVGLLLAAAAVAAMLATPQVRRTPFAPPTLPGLPPTPAGNGVPTVAPRETPTLGPSRDVQVPGWLLLAAQLFCVLLVVTAVAPLPWDLLRNGVRVRAPPPGLFPHPPGPTPAGGLPPGRARPAHPGGTGPPPRPAG